MSPGRRAPDLRPGRALVCDDVPEVLELYVRLFSRHFPNVEVDAVRNGHDAWQRVQAHPYDLVMTDYHTSGRNGIDLAIRTRLRQPNVSLVLVSAYNDFPLSMSGFGAIGLDYVIQKPFGVVPLIHAIRYLLRTSPRFRARLRRNGAFHLRADMDPSLVVDRAPSTTKWCVNGHENRMSARFCSDCGHQLPSEAAMRTYDPHRGNLELAKEFLDTLSDGDVRKVFQAGIQRMLESDAKGSGHEPTRPPAAPVGKGRSDAAV